MGTYQFELLLISSNIYPKLCAVRNNYTIAEIFLLISYFQILNLSGFIKLIQIDIFLVQFL